MLSKSDGHKSKLNYFVIPSRSKKDNIFVRILIKWLNQSFANMVEWVHMVGPDRLGFHCFHLGCTNVRGRQALLIQDEWVYADRFSGFVCTPSDIDGDWDGEGKFGDRFCLKRKSSSPAGEAQALVRRTNLQWNHECTSFSMLPKLILFLKPFFSFIFFYLDLVGWVSTLNF